MGRSGNIGWGISNYFGLPNRKKKLLTKEFLTDFKNELIRLDKENTGKNRNYEKETYMTFYGQIESSYLFYKTLKNVCKKYNLTKAIYEYAKNMAWYDSDYFDDNLVLEMVKQGIIEYDNDNYNDYLKTKEDYFKLKYKLIKKCKGYNVIEYGYWYDNKEDLEEIYRNSEWEVMWLN